MNLNTFIGDENKIMRYNKIVSWFFILMMLSGLVLIFSPNNVNAIPVTFENWDGYNIGDKSGSTIYGNWVGDWTQPVADWQVSNAWSYSGTNSYRSNTPHNGENQPPAPG